MEEGGRVWVSVRCYCSAERLKERALLSSSDLNQLQCPPNEGVGGDRPGELLSSHRQQLLLNMLYMCVCVCGPDIHLHSASV